MPIGTYGDAARWTAMSLHGARLKSAMDVLTEEMTSGEKSDLAQHLGLNASRVNEIDATLERLQAYDENAQLAQTLLDTQQAALTTFSSARDALIASGATAIDNLPDHMEATIVADAQASFDTMIGMLNTRAMGRFVFAGSNPDLKPLPDAQAILSDVAAHVDFTLPPDQVSTQIDTYFTDSTGRFRSVLYQGGAGETRIPLGDHGDITVDVTARDGALGSVLADTVKLALLSALPNQQDRAGFVRTAAVSLGAREGAIVQQGRIGQAQSSVARALSANSATRTANVMERNTRVAADPLETATKLKQAEIQLEVHYTILNRMARLSMVNFS